jgi:hypothetical protein
MNETGAFSSKNNNFTIAFLSERSSELDPMLIELDKLFFYAYKSTILPFYRTSGFNIFVLCGFSTL